MASITKQLDKKKPAYFYIDDLKASDVRIDGTQQSVLEHILNDTIHLTEAEKDKIKDIVENGAGIKPEDWEKILAELDNKADKDHTHNQDSNFFILASQVVETFDRKFVSNKEKEALSGISGNIQSQINILKLLSEEAMKFKGRYNSYAEMINNNQQPNIGDTCFVDNDETQENANTIYYYTQNNWLRIKKDEKASGGWVASSVAPTDKKLLWVDISQTKPVLKWFDGSKWIDISGLKEEIRASDIVQETDLHFVDDKSINILDKLTIDPETGYLMYNGHFLGGGNAGVGSGANIDDSKIELDSTFSSFKINEELSKKQAALGFVPEDSSNKGKENGYTPLNNEAKVSRNYLYDSTFVVSGEKERLDIVGMVEGNTCYEESTTKYFIYSSGEWQLISKGDSIVIGRNNFLADRAPNRDDDERHGYLPGSTWINKYTKKAYICTDSSIEDAQWELMAGQVTLNIGEVIPFTIDSANVIEEDNLFKYEIPTMDINIDFIEVSYNGVELIINEDYSLEDKDGKTYLVMNSPVEASDKVFGEVYKHDLNMAEQQMTKAEYDSNQNGKVDIAELADITKGIAPWQPLTRYEKDELILKDGSIFVSKDGHTSAQSFEEDKWTMLIAEAVNLNKFTTDNLKESENRKFLSSIEKTNVGQLPEVFKTVNENSKQVAINKSNITSLQSLSASNKLRLDNFKFTQLIDTPSRLTENAYLKINGTGDAITMIQNPTFAIKSIIDSTGKRYRNIDTPKFNHFEMTHHNVDNGVFTFDLKANSTDLLDMPKKHEHGKVLVSDVNNQKFVLADKEELTMSVENFTQQINEDDWQLVDDHYETVIVHDMSSEALIVSFIDEFKVENKEIIFEILNKNSIKAISSSNNLVKCTINCALGAGNGYWQYLMDWSKIDFVDDSRIRTDRAYSSSKLTQMLNSYALKSDYYSKNVADTRYASIQLEHEHPNKTVLDDINVNADGDITFKGTRLLTEMNPTTVAIEDIFNNDDLNEIYDIKTICTDHNLQAIIASEVLVQNLSDKEAILKIRDGSIDILSVTLKANEVQKYHLGISNKTKVFISGNVKTMLTISAF